MATFCRLVAFLILLLGVTTGIATAAGKPKWTLAWSDEFSGPDGSSVDPAKWVPEIGGHGWGNHELETYSGRTSNVFLHQGKLVIQAQRESYTGPDNIPRSYTSARLKTLGKFAQAYGRFEARIKIPFGQGLWPAFWMMGDDIETVDWPDCGEIDIMENIGREPNVVHGTIHGPGYSGGQGIGTAYALPHRRRMADSFHVFAVEWEPAAIRFYFDKHLYATRTPAELPPGRKWVFDHPFFLLLNVAVGGDWPGNPDSTTVFPQTMQVDFVRVYRREER